MRVSVRSCLVWAAVIIVAIPLSWVVFILVMRLVFSMPR